MIKAPLYLIIEAVRGGLSSHHPSLFLFFRLNDYVNAADLKLIYLINVIVPFLVIFLFDALTISK